MNDKHIAAIELFNANLNLRTEQNDRVFRKTVIQQFSEKFPGFSNASAVAYYNHAKTTIAQQAPELVENLGRPVGTGSGGRPVTFPYAVIDTDTGETIVDGLSKGKAKKMAEDFINRGETQYTFVAQTATVAATDSPVADAPEESYAVSDLIMPHDADIADDTFADVEYNT